MHNGGNKGRARSRVPQATERWGLDPMMHPCAVPDLVPLIGPRRGSAVIRVGSDQADIAPRLPSRRADYELRPLSGVRSRRFEEPTWGTHDFLRRKPMCLQSAGPDKGPAGFDPD